MHCSQLWGCCWASRAATPLCDGTCKSHSFDGLKSGVFCLTSIGFISILTTFVHTRLEYVKVILS